VLPLGEHAVAGQFVRRPGPRPASRVPRPETYSRECISAISPDVSNRSMVSAPALVGGRLLVDVEVAMPRLPRRTQVRTWRIWTAVFTTL
jgi:hypothetical protein